MLKTTSFIVLLPGETAPTISSYDSFVFRSVKGVYSLMPTSLRFLFINFWNWNGSPFFDLIKYRKIFLFSILLNPNATNCLRNRFQFLFDSRGPLSRYTRASLFDLKVPYPQGNSEKSTLAYSAIKFFNDLKEFSTSSSPPTFKFLPSSLKCKWRNLFLSRLSSVETLEDLLWSIYCYCIHCKCSF